MKKLMVLTILAVFAMAISSRDALAISSGDALVISSGDAQAQDPKVQTKTIFARPLIWRSDSTGGYTFTGVALANATLSADGSVVSGDSQGFCELPGYHQAEGLITGVSADWSFTGKVTLEVSVTGNAKGYSPVINGLPRAYKESAHGSRIKWRATLAPGSSLTSLRIVYSDLSGMEGSFGNELLSGFTARRQIYIKGSTAGSLFNHQVPIKVGESKKSAAPCDVKLNGGILSGFADIRFTLPDGETALPYYLESVTGKAPNRTASFWVRIPEIPIDGLPIYMYHGKALAADLSSPEKVFDFFDDFRGPALDLKKWTVTMYDASGKAGIVGSLLSLEQAKIASASYGFTSGLVEYKARASANGAAELIIRAASSFDESSGRSPERSRGASTDDDDLRAHSSVSLLASGHSIAIGSSVKSNDQKPISSGVFYTYKIYCDDSGDVAFRRYGEDGSGSAQAETAYSAGQEEASPIGLSSSLPGETMDCLWIRTRKAANPPPQVDPEKTASTVSEPVNLPEFYNVSTAPDGSLISADSASDGYYISRFVSPAFETRILKPSWEADLAGHGAEAISISIAVKKGGEFYSGWVNGITRYASKKDFEKGNQLRWKAVIANASIASPSEAKAKQSPSMQSFTLGYWSGDIRIVMPKGGETLAPGAEYIIFWEAPGYEPKYPMEIAYASGDRNDFKIIAPKTDNSGDYTWNVPEKASGKAVVKVSDYYDKAIYGISEDYFLILPGAPGDIGTKVVKSAEEAAPEEAREAGEALAPKKALAGYYDILIKVGDNTSSDGYKDGDVVMVKPAGYLWGAEEKGKFFIVRARLTPEKALELMKPGERVTTVSKSKRKVATVLKRRNFRLNLHNKITLQDRVQAAQGHLPGQPMEVPDITGMTESK